MITYQGRWNFFSAFNQCHARQSFGDLTHQVPHLMLNAKQQGAFFIVLGMTQPRFESTTSQLQEGCFATRPLRNGRISSIIYRITVIRWEEDIIGLCQFSYNKQEVWKMKHLNSCCFNLSESPSDRFHMVTWLTTAADCISGLVAANKLLLLSDPVCVRVCVLLCLPQCLFAWLFVYRCVPVLVWMTPGYLLPKRKMKSIVVFFLPPPQWTILFITSPALLCVTVCAPHAALDKHQQHLSCEQKCWMAITCPQSTKPQQLNVIQTFSFYLVRMYETEKNSREWRDKERSQMVALP